MTRVFHVLMALVIILLCNVLFAAASDREKEAGWQGKVDPLVLAAKGQTECLVFLTEQADLRGAAGVRNKIKKGAWVVAQLTAAANRAQDSVLKALTMMGVEYRPYWVANMIWMRGARVQIELIAKRADVARIYANPWVRQKEPKKGMADKAPVSPTVIEWNISQVNAPEVWANGFTGQGAVVAGADTGVQWDHPALKKSYKGWGKDAVNHDYNWHDAIHQGGGVCGADTSFPCDDGSHGTHTMGTMVGDDDGANQIGMAPGARWIACRNMNQGVGSPATYAECYQWFMAPTKINGSAPDPAKAPDVINNSWVCPASEGCNPDSLQAVVNNVRAAGIMTVQSAGNEGSTCSSVRDPAAIYEASFTVGAIDNTDTIASFSSRGPVTVDGSGRLKPNVVAPGVSIRSSIPGGAYQAGWSGTSMAAPHVAGLAALLVSANPNLAGQVDALAGLMEESAIPLTTKQGCDGDDHDTVPNNVYGWGRIDALAAYNLSLGHGSLQVVIEPLRARAAGALWRVDNGPWRKNAEIEDDLDTGEHTVSFLEVPGWIKPEDMVVAIAPGTMATVTGTYVQAGGPCPAETVFRSVTGRLLARATKTLDILRTFRYKVLFTTETGRRFARLYYRHGAELNRIFESNPALARTVADLLYKVSPALAQASKRGEGLVLARVELEQALTVLGRVQGLSGLELTDALALVKQHLQGARTEGDAGRVVVGFTP